MTRLRPKAGVVLKLLFGAGVFAWMAWSGKLNLSQVARSLSRWPAMLAIAGLGYTQIGVVAWRWRSLLQAQDIRLSFRRTWGLVMIGLLFNLALPGAVGGDLIKGYYVTRAAAGRKSNAATSVVMDRVIGLIGLLFLGAAMAAVNLRETMRSPATRSLGLLTAGGLVAALAGLYAAVMAGNRLSGWDLLPGVLKNVFRALHEYRKKSRVIPKALGLSVLNQGITCGMYYLALQTTGAAQLPMGQFFLIVPLGLVTTAIPISPGGIGVGQAAFFALFKIVAPAYASAGTDAFTAFQVMTILLCLSGAYWYVSHKHL